MTDQKDIRGVPRGLSADLQVFLTQVRNSVHRMRDSMVIWDELRKGGLADSRRNITFTAIVEQLQEAIEAGGGGGGGGDPDLTMPPTPTDVAITAGITSVIVTWAAPIYTVGHGHQQANIYAVRLPADSPTLPTYVDAVRLDSAPGALTIRSLPSEPNTKWHVWVKWQSADGVESDPGGGVNGVSATTGQDVSNLLAVLADKITADELAASLATPIGQIPGLVTVTGQLQARTGVRLDVNGYVTGWSMNNDGSSGNFVIRADTFAIGSPGVLNVYPVIVRTSSTVENGVTIPAGAYFDSAYMVNVQAMWARFGTLVVDSVQATAINAAKLTLGDGTVGGNLKSSNYVSGSLGWIVTPAGYAEFNNVVVRGTIFASSGAIGGSLIGATYMMSVGWISGSYGWRLNSDGTGWVGGIYMDLSSIRSANYVLNTSGFALRADGTGQIGGLKVTTTSIESSNFATGVAGMRIGLNGDVEINNLTARGNITANHLNAAGGTFSGLLTADAVDAVDTINLKGNALIVPVGVEWEGDAAAGTSTYPNIIASTPATDFENGAVIVVATVTLQGGAALNDAYLHLFRDGVQIRVGGRTKIAVSGSGVNPIYTTCVVAIVDRPGPGSHVYGVGGRVAAGNVIRVTNVTCACFGAKKS